MHTFSGKPSSAKGVPIGLSVMGSGSSMSLMVFLMAFILMVVSVGLWRRVSSGLNTTVTSCSPGVRR